MRTLLPVEGRSAMVVGSDEAGTMDGESEGCVDGWWGTTRRADMPEMQRKKISLMNPS